MGRLRGVGSFLLVTVVVLLGLRAAHWAIGVAYPISLPGPFHLESLADVESHTGFSPHIPFYRPISLGTVPAEIVAERRPFPKSHVAWRGQSFLELTEWSGGYRPPIAADASLLQDHPQVRHWSDAGVRIAVLQVGEQWIRVRTDLDDVELRRIVDTLLPYNRLL